MSMTGKIVKSKAGHDKGLLFVISGVSDKEDGYVFIADGRSRRIEKPKKKKLKHLLILDGALETDESFTNRKIRDTISKLKADLN